MESLKKGDLIEIKNSDYMLRVPKGSRLFVKNQLNQSIVQIECILHVEMKDIKKIGASQMQYEESNCYKLKQAIKKTGISSEKLSLANTKGKTKYHFYSYTKKSRLTDRGDISDARLNKLLTDLRHAEREVLGIGAKTVEDENHISKETNSLIYRNSWDEDARKRLNDEIRQSLSNICAKRSSSRNHDDHVDATSCGFTETDFKENQKSNKPLFIGATVVIFIVLILFILNNYLQVV